MSKEHDVGRSRVLGVPYMPFEPGIGKAFMDATQFKEAHSDPSIIQVFQRILDINPGKIHVIQGSKFHDMLEKMGVLSRVTVCEMDAVPELLMKKNNFVFADTNEYRQGVGEYLYNLFYCRPPNLLSFNHLNVLRMHWDRIWEIACSIDDAAKKDGKNVILFGRHYPELVMVDLLYLLCKKAEYVNKFIPIRTNGVDSPLASGLASKDTHIIVIWNRIELGLLEHRQSIQTKAEFDYYFIHGEQSSKSNLSLLHDPVLFWGYPFAGSGRVEQTFSEFLPKIGMYYCNKAQTNYFHQDLAPRFPGSVRTPLSDEYTHGDNIIDLYKIMPMASIASLHRFYYDAENILSVTNGKMIIIIRDFRDVIVSFTNWFYGGVNNIYNFPAKDKIMTVLKSERLSFDKITETMVRLKKNPHVYFIKFEEINKDPFNAYHELFKWLGIANDPFYDIHQVKNTLEKAAANAHPDTYSLHCMDKKWASRKGKAQLFSGSQGKWKAEFDDGAKQYFKDHGNGILQCFGYESDDNW